MSDAMAAGTVREDLTILIVDDEEPVLRAFENYLDDRFQVIVASSGESALSAVSESIDLVLLDRRMPEMDGDEVLSRLRREGYTMPVVMVTGVEPDVDVVDMAFDDYLTKPVDEETLVRTVRIQANRQTFERHSREFFRLATKIDSLESASVGTDSTEYRRLLDRLRDLQEGLDETIEHLGSPVPEVEFRAELDPDETQQLLEGVWDHTLPDDIRTLIEDYQALPSARPLFMWKWVHRLAPQNTLPCVAPEYEDEVPGDKTIAILFVTLLDDLLEKHSDRETFGELAKLPSAVQRADAEAPGVSSAYVRFTRRVWETLLERLDRAPHFDAYADLFRFDVEQAIAAIRYSDLAIRHPGLATLEDLERYDSHNMVMFAYADIDLMHSPLAAKDDIAPLRESVWTAQLMARIGNWLSTWERELREGDFSSGMVVASRQRGVVSEAELERARDDDSVANDLVDRIKAQGLESDFLRRWERHYHTLQRLDADIESIDMAPFIEGMSEVLRYHLATTGMK